VEGEGSTPPERDGDSKWRTTVGGLLGLKGDPFGREEKKGNGPGTWCC